MVSGQTNRIKRIISCLIYVYYCILLWWIIGSRRIKNKPLLSDLTTEKNIKQKFIIIFSDKLSPARNLVAWIFIVMHYIFFTRGDTADTCSKGTRWLLYEYTYSVMYLIPFYSPSFVFFFFLDVIQTVASFAFAVLAARCSRGIV